MSRDCNICSSSSLSMSLLQKFGDIEPRSRIKYNGCELEVDLGLEYPNNKLFDFSSFSLQHGFIYGIVGANGVGKSSLVDALCSKIIPGFPKDLSIGLIRSDQKFEDGDRPAIEYLSKRIRKFRLDLSNKIEQQEELLESVTDDDEIYSISERLSRLYEVADSFDDERNEEKIQRILNELGFKSHGLETVNVNNLSGGWKVKCHLAKVACSLPELLVVDEPSFMDEEATRWFLEFLQTSKKNGSIVLLISHKEKILASACDRILNITPEKKLEQFNGSYDAFINNVKHQRSVVSSLEGKLSKKEDAYARTLRTLKKKIAESEKSLGKTIQKNGSDKRFIKGRSKEKKQRAGKSAKAKAKQLNEDKRHVESLRRNEFEVQKLKIVGEKLENPLGLVSLNNVSFGYSSSALLLKNIDLQVAGNDRIALVGSNGAGKSTLVKLIVGEIQATTGTTTRSAKPRIVYFPQAAAENIKLEFGSMTSVEYMVYCSPRSISVGEARQHLASFGLKKDVPLRKINGLSTGQRTRLYLAKAFLLQPKPNILILDEVSDNLDTETVKLLVDSLKEFQGAVIAISHQEDDFLLQFATKRWTIKNKNIQELTL